MLTKNQYRKKEGNDNNRLHLVFAVIFLIFTYVLFCLYGLQISKYDYYTALASGQHQVYTLLEPDRGRIFIQDSHELSDDKLYPIATNKDFGLVYAVPNLIEKPEEVAVKLYELFDKERIKLEVEKLLDSDDFFSSTTLRMMSVLDTKEKEDFKQVKKEAEIKLREDAQMEEYLIKLSKKNDPYEPLKKKVDEEKLKELKELNIRGIDYIMESHRYYPEKNIGSHLLGFVGFSGDEISGRYGLEGFFDTELKGERGSVRAERSAKGELIIINDREYKKPKNGADFILTINRSIQFHACKKLNEAVESYEADGGSVVVMDPITGAIIAMCSSPDYDPNNYRDVEDGSVYNNPAIFNTYEPGSIFKVFTVAAGLDQEKITPNSIYEDKGYVMIEGWNKPIKNSDFKTKGGHGWVDMNFVLAESLNTGTIFIENKVGHNEFSKYVRNFGFGEKTGIELQTEGLSNIVSLLRNRIRPVEAATASFGQGITATPLQLVTAYSAIANGGILMKPYLVEEIRHSNGDIAKTQPQQVRRVISERSSLLLSAMMVNVVDGGHAKLAGVDGYFVAGKTGTAQVADEINKGYGLKTAHTFVGFAPVDDPKFVMLVKLDDPKTVEFSASSAAPLFGEISKYILNYYQVLKER